MWTSLYERGVTSSIRKGGPLLARCVAILVSFQVRM